MEPTLSLAAGQLTALGEEKNGQAWTLIRFMDGATLLVHWDGRYEVSGPGRDGQVTIYQPNGRRTHIPGHRIAMVEHQNAPEDDE